MGKTKSNTTKNYAIPGKPMTEKEFLAFIKEGEKGPFKEHGTFEDFKKDILAAWKKKYGK